MSLATLCKEAAKTVMVRRAMPPLNPVQRLLGGRLSDTRALLSLMGIEQPYDWQTELLGSRRPQIAMRVHRQSGKSTCTAIKAVRVALNEPGETILIISPSERQSLLLFQKCQETYYRIAGSALEPKKDNRLELVTPSGSTIIALPGTEKTTRGYSHVRMVIIDEASRVPDVVYKSVRPMLSTHPRGQLILPSTPYGKRGFFYDVFVKGRPEDWLHLAADVTKCHHISPWYLEQERVELGDLFYRQEYMVEFLDTVEQVFSTVYIDRMPRDEIEPLYLDDHSVAEEEIDVFDFDQFTVPELAPAGVR